MRARQRMFCVAWPTFPVSTDVADVRIRVHRNSVQRGVILADAVRLLKIAAVQSPGRAT